VEGVSGTYTSYPEPAAEVNCLREHAYHTIGKCRSRCGGATSLAPEHIHGEELENVSKVKDPNKGRVTTQVN